MGGNERRPLHSLRRTEEKFPKSMGSNPPGCGDTTASFQLLTLTLQAQTSAMTKGITLALVAQCQGTSRSQGEEPVLNVDRRCTLRGNAHNLQGSTRSPKLPKISALSWVDTIEGDACYNYGPLGYSRAL